MMAEIRPFHPAFPVTDLEAATSAVDGKGSGYRVRID